MSISEPDQGQIPVEHLSPAQKLAILKYMLVFVIPSAAVVAVLAGISGYVLGGIGKITAEQQAVDAAEKATTKTFEIIQSAQKALNDNIYSSMQALSQVANSSAQSAAEAKSNASASAAQAAQAVANLTLSVEQAQRSAKAVAETAANMKNLSSQLEGAVKGEMGGLAKALWDIPNFQEVLLDIPENQLKANRKRIESIESSLYTSKRDLVPSVNGQCPPGTYAVGLQSVSVPGGRAGYVESVSLMCRAIVLQKPL